MEPEVEDLPGGAQPRRTAPAVGSSRFSSPGAVSLHGARSKRETQSSSPVQKSSSVAGAGGEGSGKFPHLCIEPGRTKQSELCKDWGIINSLFIVDIWCSLGVQSSLRRAYRRVWSPWLSPRCSAWTTAM